MRTKLVVALLLAACEGGCQPIPTWRESAMAVAGTVDFTSTPRAVTTPGEHGGATSGALPLAVLYCKASFGPDWSATVVRLGEGCVVDLAHPVGTCDLPTKTAHLRIAVTSASAAFAVSYRTGYGSRYRQPLVISEEPPLNVVIGGETVDGSYVTYRFTGSAIDLRAREDCDKVLPASVRPPPLPKREDSPRAEDWSAWEDGTLSHP